MISLKSLMKTLLIVLLIAIMFPHGNSHRLGLTTSTEKLTDHSADLTEMVVPPVNLQEDSPERKLSSKDKPSKGPKSSKGPKTKRPKTKGPKTAGPKTKGPKRSKTTKSS